MALARLGLHQVWWLVSPQNPLKSVEGMAPLAQRLEAARRFATHPRIVVTDIERALGTRYTADTLHALQCRFPDTNFVWLMGADNLIQVRHWRRWPEIFATVPIAVCDRPGYALRAAGCLAAHRFATARIDGKAATALADRTPPAWAFFHSRLNPASSTALRRLARSA